MGAASVGTGVPQRCRNFSQMTGLWCARLTVQAGSREGPCVGGGSLARGVASRPSWAHWARTDAAAAGASPPVAPPSAAPCAGRRLDRGGGSISTPSSRKRASVRSDSAAFTRGMPFNLSAMVGAGGSSSSSGSSSLFSTPAATARRSALPPVKLAPCSSAPTGFSANFPLCPSSFGAAPQALEAGGPPRAPGGPAEGCHAGLPPPAPSLPPGNCAGAGAAGPRHSEGGWWKPGAPCEPGGGPPRCQAPWGPREPGGGG